MVSVFIVFQFCYILLFVSIRTFVATFQFFFVFIFFFSSFLLSSWTTEMNWIGNMRQNEHNVYDFGSDSPANRTTHILLYSISHLSCSCYCYCCYCSCSRLVFECVHVYALCIHPFVHIFFFKRFKIFKTQSMQTIEKRWQIGEQEKIE